MNKDTVCRNRVRLLALFTVLIVPVCALAQYTPWAEDEFPMNLYWGDTHLHSSYSVDANTMGNTALSPAAAYRFARGEPVRANNGMLARLNRPLDFLVVSDHAELMGMMLKLREGDPRLLRNPEARRIHEAMQSAHSDEAASAVMQEFLAKMGRGEAMFENREVSMDVWKDSIAMADKYNAPGNLSNGRMFQTSDMLQHEYARSALKLGLSLEGKTGSNPYQFGMIGSTDSHTSLATGAEDNFWGKASIVEPGADRASGESSNGFTAGHPDTELTKGWMDSAGELRETVYNVAASDGRAIHRDGSVEAVTSTADVKNATYLNSVGAAQLSAYWQDPDFDPAQRAFYYARVIEIPTPRWTAYDAVRLGQPVNPADKKIVQDRAYSSPIWYSP